MNILHFHKITQQRHKSDKSAKQPRTHWSAPQPKVILYIVLRNLTRQLTINLQSYISTSANWRFFLR
jgi:hypothetical protein